MSHQTKRHRGVPMDLEDLHKRLARLEDIQEIQQLVARYCEICDYEDYDTDALLQLFTVDATWDASFATVKGHDAIRALFAEFPNAIKRVQHIVANPQIVVEGDKARGSWYLISAGEKTDGSMPKWPEIFARYHQDYVKQNGEWKICHLRVEASRGSAE